MVIYLSENKNRHIDHTDLGVALNVSKTNLSNIIKRIFKYHLFSCEKIGRNKYYYLSNEGMEYYEYLIKEENKKFYLLAKSKLA